MKNPTHRFTLSLLPAILAVGLSACGPSSSPGTPEKTPPPSTGGHDHDAPGPHGGELAVIGDHAAHIELVHDAAGAALKIYALGPDGKTGISLSAPPRFNMMVDNAPVQVEGEAMEGGYALKHPSLAQEPNGHLVIELEGKQYQMHMHPPGAHH